MTNSISFTLKNTNYYNLLSDYLVLKRYLIKSLCNTNFSLMHLKGQKKKITILRSPFIYKKSQEHFYIRYFSFKVYLLLPFSVNTAYQNSWLFSFFKKNILALSSSFYKISYKKNCN